MPRLYRQGDEPVSGYRLLRQIGRGGFGEVWQAAAPGGAEVAFKIVDVGERAGLRQWRSLQKLKKIRHPNLVPILALWLRDEFGDLILDGPRGGADQSPAELYLAMGLGEKSLLDRLKECKNSGELSIPVAELLTYLEDAARGLDHLASPKHDLGAGPAPLPHGDVKPQNILVVGDAAQVGDFGLNALLGDAHASKQASLSVAFSAPETLEGQPPSAAADQYSLAVVYCYLRTGYLPYSRNDPDTILLEALEGRLDLTKLSAAEQEVLRQATALKPSSRFGSCLDMARELRRAVEHADSTQASLVIEPGAEAVPGHKLVKCLGRGAYGEVWEALAPGRVPVALKIIRDLDRAGGRGKQEFKALELIQRVAHNNLMELRAYWLLDKHGGVIPDEFRGRPGAPAPTTLVIASKLADKNLAQLLDEHVAHGEAGVPPLALLELLKQVAHALDYLNSPRHRLGDRLVSIQHRDVKPDNIMLVGETAKLTDFGLAKVVELEDTSAEIHQDSVGFTFHYAAPEVLRGRVTKWSDQYALAITYHYLRTGMLPYDKANSAYELMMQQLEGRLDLSYLPEPERRVVARATNVIPEKRFHTCTAFIESLEMAIPADGRAPLAKRPPARSHAAIDLESRARGKAGDDLTPRRAPSAADLSLAQGRAGVLAPGDPRLPREKQTHHRPELEPDQDEQFLTDAVHDAEGEPLAAVLKRHSTMTGDQLAMELPPADDGVATLEEALARKPALGAPPRPTSPLPTIREGQADGVMSPVLLKELRKGQDENRGRRLKSWPFILAGAILVSLVLGGIAMMALLKPPQPTKLAEGSGSGPAPTTEAQPSASAPRLFPTASREITPVLGSLPQPSSPVPPPKLDLVLGQKEPTDPELPKWLAGELERLIGSVEKPTDFALAYEGLKPTPAHAVTGKLQAFRAECLAEGTSPNLAQAAQLADEAIQAGDEPKYARYVRARIHQLNKEPAKAARLLAEAVASDVSLFGFRRGRAAAIFQDSLSALKVSADPKKLTASTAAAEADKPWLKGAVRFATLAPEFPAVEPRLHLFLLGDAESAPLDELLSPAARLELKKRPQGAVLLAALLLKAAERDAAAKPEAALRAYADLALLCRAEPGLSAQAPLEHWSRVLKPGLELEAKVSPAAPGPRSALAALYAGKGRLIWENPFENWPFGPRSAYREAAAAYGKALEKTPAGDPARAELHTYRGLCLSRVGFDKLTEDDIKQIETDAEAAIAANPNHAGGWSLRGEVALHRASGQPTAEGIKAKAKDALAAYDRAIELASRPGQTDENLFFYFNNRSVAGLFLAAYEPKEEQPKILARARQDAEQATRLGPESDLAWNAQGTVLEQLAWSGGGGQKQLYPEAEAAFSRQITLRPAEADGHFNRGRLLAKWVLDDGGDKARLADAERDLQEGLRLEPAPCDGHFWLGRLRLENGKLPEAVAAFEEAVKRPKATYQDVERVARLLLPKHTKETRQVITAALPPVTRLEPRHAAILTMRSNLLRAQFPDDMNLAIDDADRAAKLAQTPEGKLRAHEAAAFARFVQFRKAGADSDTAKRQRAECLEHLRAGLKEGADLPSVWPVARTLVTLLEEDAVKASDAGDKKKLLEEAVAAIRVAIDKAPPGQRSDLERIRRSLQEALAKL